MEQPDDTRPKWETRLLRKITRQCLRLSRESQRYLIDWLEDELDQS